MSACLQNALPTSSGRCRSIVKSVDGDGCGLLSQTFDVLSTEDMFWQYFDRPAWYQGLIIYSKALLC